MEIGLGIESKGRDEKTSGMGPLVWRAGQKLRAARVANENSLEALLHVAQGREELVPYDHRGPMVHEGAQRTRLLTWKLSLQGDAAQVTARCW